MKLEVCAEIKGGFIINGIIASKSNPYDFSIFEKDSRLYISVVKTVVNYENYITKCIERNGVREFVLTNPEIYQDMIELLQYIESSGSFNIDIESINWDEPQITWIPEIEEEKGIMPLLSHQRNIDNSKRPKLLLSQNLTNIVMCRKMLKFNHIPFTYYKQAKNLFEKQDYYFAYINYFMMLEYCFGDGQFKKDALLKAFKSSGLLLKSIKTVFKIIDKEGKGNHKKWLINECSNRNKEYSENILIYLFVEYRGILSHATKKSEKYLYNKSELFNITSILSLVCLSVCGNLQISGFMRDEQKAKWIKDSLDKTTT